MSIIVQISKKELEGLAQLHCTKEEMCAYFDCCGNTLLSRINEFYSCGFKEFYDRFSGKGKVSLRRASWRSALKGDWHPLKYLMDNHLGMSETTTQRHVGPSGGPIESETTIMTLEEKKAEAAKRNLPTEVFEK